MIRFTTPRYGSMFNNIAKYAEEHDQDFRSLTKSEFVWIMVEIQFEGLNSETGELNDTETDIEVYNEYLKALKWI